MLDRLPKLGLIAVSRGGLESWGDPLTFVPLIASLVLLPAFVAIEKRFPHPMLDLSLFDDPGLAAFPRLVEKRSGGRLRVRLELTPAKEIFEAGSRSTHIREGKADLGWDSEGLTDIPAWLSAGAVAVSLGGPMVGDALKGATVAAKVVGHGRADKIRIVKFRRRKHHRKQMGHRQHYTEIQITGIAGGKK